MIFPIIQFISRNVKCWDAKTSQSENVLYPLTKRIQGVLRFRVLPVPKQPVGGDQTHSCSGGTARWGHRALRKGSFVSVGQGFGRVWNPSLRHKGSFMSVGAAPLGGPKRGAMYKRCAGGAGAHRGAPLQTSTNLSFNSVGAALCGRPKTRPSPAIVAARGGSFSVIFGGSLVVPVLFLLFPAQGA
jgi:hypothetical protein